MKKLLLSLVMTVAAFISCHAFTVDGVNYSVSNGVATVTGASSKAITRLVIPATVTSGGKTYPVNYVGSLAFNNYSSLKELIIEDSDTEISCPWYTNSKGWSVMGNPFDGCPLEKIYIGRNTAFRYSNGNYRADHLPLYPTTHNLDLTIAGKATFVISGAVPGSFRGFTNLSSLTIGGNVENIYKEAFKNCTALKKITLLAGETNLNFAENTVFEGCVVDTVNMSRNLSSPIIKTGVVVIKKDLPKIESQQFVDSDLSAVIFEDSEQELEVSTAYAVFNGCDIDSLYYGRTIKNNNANIANLANIKHVTFGPNIVDITSNYISLPEVVETVSMSNNVTNIGERAFSNCKSLKEINLPESVTRIDKSAFWGCENLSSVNIPESVNYIGDDAFAHTAIPEINVPAAIQFIGQQAFADCKKLKKVTFADSDNEIEISTAYSVFTACEIDSLYYGRTIKNNNGNIATNAKIKHVTFGPQIKTVYSNYISDHSELESAILSQNTSVIDDNAFFNCKSLKEINLPESVTRIDKSAFLRCENLSGIKIPESVNYIGDEAFGHTSIPEVHFPASVQFIGQLAFYDCKNLKKVTFADSDNEIEISTAYSVFNECEIDSLYYGRTIKNNNGNIATNANIKHVTFGPQIKTIYSNYISRHRETQSVTLSENVSAIADQAFLDCSGLTTIHSLATVPPVCENKDVFANEVYNCATVIVPMGTKKSYRDAEVWKLFSKLASDGDGYKVTVTYDSSMGDVMLNGVSTSTAMLDEDEPLTVAINPTENHEIAAVTVNGVNVTDRLIDNTLSYNALDSNLDIKVEFRIITYSITIPTDLKGGRIIIEGTDNELNPDSINIGSVVTITLVPDRGHSLSALTVNGSDFIETLNQDMSFNLLIDRDITIDATFVPEVYTITSVSQSDYGTITLNGESNECRVEFGQPLVIKLMPRDEGCYFMSLTIDGNDMTADVIDNTYTVESVEADMTVEAQFGFYTYTIEYSCDPDQGSITSGLPDDNGTSVTVAHGTEVVLTITPAEGFEIATVMLDGKDVTANIDGNGNLTLPRVNANHNVEATFDIKRVYLTVLGLDGGQIAMRYDYGSEVTLLIAAEEGWEFHSLTVGNLTVTELDADGTFTTPALTDDTAVSVVFTLAGESKADAPAHASLITVTAAGHTITVEGADDNDNVEVFDTNGITIYRGTDHMIDINRDGIHIVRVAGRTFKVMLR